MPIENIKHGKYIVELKPGYSIYKQITAPQFGAFGEKDLGGANFSLGWSYITQPFLMVDESHHHDFEQYVFIVGGDPTNVYDFDAEIEVQMDGEVYRIDYPHCVHIVPGVEHGHMRILRVNKPMMFIDITIHPGPSIRPVPEESK